MTPTATPWLRGRVAHVLGMAVGATLLGILGAIPFVGFLVIVVAACVGVGMIVLGLRTQFGSDAYVERRDAAAVPYVPGPPSGPGPASG